MAVVSITKSEATGHSGKSAIQLYKMKPQPTPGVELLNKQAIKLLDPAVAQGTGLTSQLPPLSVEIEQSSHRVLQLCSICQAHFHRVKVSCEKAFFIAETSNHFPSNLRTEVFPGGWQTHAKARLSCLSAKCAYLAGRTR
jgi:hypothetical protein